MPDAMQWAYRDGQLVDYNELTIHAESMAMRYGLSAFEGIRGYVQAGGRVRFFALDEHVARLSRTLYLSGLPPLVDGEAERAAEMLLAANGPTADCYLRVAVNAVAKGTVKDGVRAAMFASLSPMGRKKWLERGDAIAVAISTRRKPSDDMFPQQAKLICNYAGPRLAALDALQAGFDEVVLVSHEGYLAEAPTANVFIVTGSEVRTPRLCDGILAGITRKYVLRLCSELGWRVHECALTAADAYGASEAFLCGTGLELAPIGRFDQHRLPRERRLFPRLTAAYFALVRDIAVPVMS